MNWSQLWLSPDPTFLLNSTLIETGLGPPFFQNSAYKKGEPQVSCGGILCLCVCVCVCTNGLPWTAWTTLASLVSLRLQPAGGGHVVLSPIHSTSNTWSPVTYRASPTCFPCTPERPGVEDKDRGRKTHIPLFALHRPSFQEATVDLAVFTLLAQPSVRWMVEYKASKSV